MVRAVDHEQVVVRIELQARRAVELSVAGALLPPSSDVLPFGVELEKREAGVRVEYLDPALVLVCAVDVAVASYGDSDRPDELVPGKVCHVVFVDGHLADPREDVRPALVDRIPQAAADDEQDVVSRRRYVHRVAEAARSAVRALIMLGGHAADAVAVVPRPSGYGGGLHFASGYGDWMKAG